MFRASTEGTHVARQIPRLASDPREEQYPYNPTHYAVCYLFAIAAMTCSAAAAARTCCLCSSLASEAADLAPSYRGQAETCPAAWPQPETGSHARLDSTGWGTWGAGLVTAH